MKHSYILKYSSLVFAFAARLSLERVRVFCVFIFLNILPFFSNTITAQCDVATVSGSTLTPTCSNQTSNLGAGESIYMTFVNGDKYEFSITNNAQSAGVCIGGANQGSTTFTYTAASSANIKVGPYRNNGTWASSSAVITYKKLPPTTQATTFTFSAVTTNTITASWTRGNGSNILVIAKAGSAPADPTSGTSYTANSVYGSGTQVNSGGYAVYSGTGTSVKVTGLLAGTTYYFAAYEYTAATNCYNLVQLEGNQATTSPYKATINSASVGSAQWCVNETRTVTVNITNSGSAAWTDGGGNDFNVGVKWNADADYLVRVDAGNLAAGSSATYTFTVTAPAAAGSENLTFDVVKESDCWFGGNSGSCGSGNSAYTTTAQTINALPATPAPISASTTTVTCGGTLALSINYPTGGTISTSGGYRIHTFTSNGTFTTPTGFTPGTVEALVVGGGGGGGSNGGGGGGGGGVNYSASNSVAAATGYAVTVGAGGAAGSSGSNSTFNGLTGTGGGRGASRDSGGAASAGGSGGGGAGATTANSTASTAGAAGGSGTSNAGGAGVAADAGCWAAGGGGGGAGGAGTAASTNSTSTSTAGNGGAGVAYSISGSSVYYGAGGGGGWTGYTGGACNSPSGWNLGGTGGSGVGGNGESSAGTANTGSGGGAEYAGGSGVVIVRYPDVSGGTWSTSNAATATVTPTGGVVTGIAAGTAVISYSYTNPGGCSSTAVTYTVTVPGAPTGVTATVTPNPVCTSTTLTLTASGSNVTSWSWAGPNSFTSSSQNTTRSSLTSSDAGTYTITATNACGSTAATATTLTVTTLPTATISYADAPFCQSVTSGTVTLTGSSGGTYSAGAGLTINATTGVINANTSTPGTYTVTYTIASSGGCSAVTATTTVSVYAAPAITGQPSDPSAINAGAGAATFTVSASGGGLTYQWQQSTDAGSTYANISNGGYFTGCTSASLVITNPPASYNGRMYRCVVSGCTPSATSNGATLTVNTLGNESPCYGTTQNYNVTNVSGVTYTWTYPSGWSVVSGQGTNSINLLVGVNSGTITVTPSTCGGNGTARSIPVSVASVSVTPSTLTVCSGATASYTATPNNAGTPTYQWVKNGTDISGATSATYSTTSLADNDVITVKMTSSAGCLITSSPIVMTVYPNNDINDPAIAIGVDESTTACSGDLRTFRLSGGNAAVTPTYQWKLDGANVGTGATTYTTVFTATATTTYTVSVVMTSSSSCISGSPATSNLIEITAYPTYTASATVSASPSTTVCYGTSVTYTVVPTNGGTPTYEWRNGSTVVGSGSSFTSSSLSDGDPIYVMMTSSLPCISPIPAASNTVTAKVNLDITNNVISSDQAICTGSTPSILTGTTPVGGNGTYTYLWESSTDNTTYSTTGVTTSTISPGALTQTTWYRRVVTSSPCADNTSDPVMITVYSTIANNTITSQSTSICSGNTPLAISGSIPTGGSGTYTYAWEESTTSSTAGFSTIGGETAQDYQPGALTADTWYRRIVSSSLCSSSTSTAVGVYINPNLPASVSISASSTSICSGDEVVFTPTPTNGGTAPSYQWKKNGSNITGEVFSTYTASSLADGDDITVVMTSNAAPCLTGSPATSAAINMTVNAIPLITVSNSAQTVCSGVALTTMTMGTSNAVAGTTYAWERDNTVDVTGIAASGTGNISGTFTNATSEPVTVTFTITPTGPANTNCEGPSTLATVLVNPAMPATPDTIYGIGNAYAGFTEKYYTNAVDGATSYTWAVPTGWSISSGQGTVKIFAVAGSAGDDGDITVTSTNACGSSSAFTFPVTVTANTTANTTICEGTTQRYTTQYREGVLYDWSVPADWTIVSGDSTNSILVTIGATSGNVEVVAASSCGDSPARTLAVTANPLPVMTSTDETEVCSGTALSLTLTANPASTFSWEAYDRESTTGESDSPQTTSTITDVITTTVTAVDTVVYSVTPTSLAGCAGGGTAGSLDPQLVTVLVKSGRYWTGNVDNDWFNTGNWCEVPNCSRDAFIPASVSSGRYPQIGAAGAACRNLILEAGGSAALTTLTTWSLSVCGDWTNNGTYTANSGLIKFVGTGNQTITGNAAQSFYKLEIANTGSSGSDNVTLAQPTTVTNQLTLTDGILNTDATNLLTLTNAASTATNEGNSGSYVSGPMRWNGINGAGPFVFPTGKKASSKWARIAIADLTAATDFYAEYFDSAYTYVHPDYNAANPTPVLSRVSAKEYWTFDRVSGTGTGNLTLYWEDASWSGIDDCAQGGSLKIAHWDAANATNALATPGSWENNNDSVNITGTCGTSGTITTELDVTEFSPFTFGSDELSVNPLPVELLYFNATFNGKTVDLNWKTASEINNDYFTVERSIDGVNFVKVGVIASYAKGGNSTTQLSYYLNDNDVNPGVYYYRLKQTDFNGEFKYSNVDVVEIKGDVTFGFNVVPNPSDGDEVNALISAEKGQEIVIVVYDVLGQEIYSKIVITEQKGNTVYAIDLMQKLSSGVYMITATSDNKVYSKRLVVN